MSYLLSIPEPHTVLTSSTYSRTILNTNSQERFTDSLTCAGHNRDTGIRQRVGQAQWENGSVRMSINEATFRRVLRSGGPSRGCYLHGESPMKYWLRLRVRCCSQGTLCTCVYRAGERIGLRCHCWGTAVAGRRTGKKTS